MTNFFDVLFSDMLKFIIQLFFFFLLFNIICGDIQRTVKKGFFEICSYLDSLYKIFNSTIGFGDLD